MVRNHLSRLLTGPPLGIKCFRFQGVIYIYTNNRYVYHSISRWDFCWCWRGVKFEYKGDGIKSGVTGSCSRRPGFCVRVDLYFLARGTFYPYLRKRQTVGCQNYGRSWGPHDSMAPDISGTRSGPTIIQFGPPTTLCGSANIHCSKARQVCRAQPVWASRPL